MYLVQKSLGWRVWYGKGVEQLVCMAHPELKRVIWLYREPDGGLRKWVNREFVRNLIGGKK